MIEFKKAILLFIFIFSSLFIGGAQCQPSIVFQDFSIVVSSSDKYRELWHPFFYFLFKNWPSLRQENSHIPIFLITSDMSYPDPRITVIKAGKSESWSTGISKALNQVKTKYVLYLQEDFIIHYPIDEFSLEYFYKIMDKEKASYLELTFDSFFSNEPLHPVYQDIAIKNRFSEFRTALQASFWDKSVFISLLNVQENPWEFENYGSVRSQKENYHFWIVQKNHPIVYLNACDRGYWNNAVLKYIQLQGIEIPVRRLPIDKDHSLIHWIKHYYPRIYKQLLNFDSLWLNNTMLRHENI